MDALSEHVRTGRLDLDEYSERSKRVTAARAVTDLAPLFTDLPAPHPSALHSADPERRPQPARTARRGQSAALIPIAVVGGLLVLFVLPRMPGLLVVLVVIALAGLVFARRRGT